MRLFTNVMDALMRFRPARFFVRLFQRTWAAYVGFHTLAAYKMQMAAYLGIFGFPAFYAMFVWVSPQAYESPWLRSAGFLISLLLGFSDHWAPRYKRFLPIYSYLAFLFAIPVFFVFMMLMNGANTTWQLSTLAAFVYVALLYDSRNVLVVSIVGTLLGWLGYLLATDGAPLPPGSLELVPIVGFALAGLLALNYSDSKIADEKMQAASRLASQIAHEMRTPLLGITFDAEAANKHLDKLTTAYEWALENGYEGRRFGKQQRLRLQGSMDRIREHTQSANLVVDMLLVNAGQENFSSDAFDTFSALDVVENALARYHFRPGERERVYVEHHEDFLFFGSNLLLVHTLFNLLKNALRAVDASKGDDGRIVIRLEPGDAVNNIVISDNGPGIAPDVLPHIFVPFYTGERHNQGTGIGLAFSRFVVESFEGSLRCYSVQGQGATFVIALPVVPPEASTYELQVGMTSRKS